MKHKASFIVAVGWVTLLVVLGVFLLFTANPHTRMSETENRMLAGFPKLSPATLASGDFMAGFESFLSDGFFGRTEVINASERLLNRFSVLSGDDLYAMQAEDMEKRLNAELENNPQYRASEEDGEADTADDETVEVPGLGVPEAPGLEMPETLLDASAMDNEDVEPVSDAAAAAVMADDIPLTDTMAYNWLTNVDDSKTIICEYPIKRVQYYAETLKIMQSYLPEDGTICFTQVPLSSMATRWLNQTRVYKGWGSSAEIMLEKCLEGTERIYVFDTMKILEPYMQEGKDRLFYLTDHHWSPEGAFPVFAEMMKKLGNPVIPYDEYTYKAIQGNPDARGNVDTFNSLYPLLPGHSYVVKHRTDMKEISLMNYDIRTYLTFMNNTQFPWRRIITGANTGRKALVICDSFGNCFTPYLLPYYDEVDMCDFRKNYYNRSDAGGSIGENMQYFGIDDVYIIVSTANDLRRDNSTIYLRQYLVP